MKREIKQQEYEIHSALREDLNEGWVWIENRQLEEDLNHRRRVVRIDSQGRKRVYCEALYLDDYYVKRFNEARREESTRIVRRGQNLIFINGWYRHNLGISAGARTLSISVSKSPWWQLRASLQHPQVGIFLTTVLAIMGVGLAVLGMGLGLISVKDLLSVESGARSSAVVTGCAVVVIGFGVVVWGIVQLRRRARAA